MMRKSPRLTPSLRDSKVSAPLYEQDITKQKLNRVSSICMIEETTRRKESFRVYRVSGMIAHWLCAGVKGMSGAAFGH